MGKKGCKKEEIKDGNVMIDRQIFYDYPVKNDRRIYNNVRKITIGQGDDYKTGYLQDYPYFKENYKLTVTDLSKQQGLDVNLKATQQLNFTGNLNRPGQRTMLFITEKAKETILDFSRETVRIL